MSALEYWHLQFLLSFWRGAFVSVCEIAWATLEGQPPLSWWHLLDLQDSRTCNRIHNAYKLILFVATILLNIWSFHFCNRHVKKKRSIHFFLFQTFFMTHNVLPLTYFLLPTRLEGGITPFFILIEHKSIPNLHCSYFFSFVRIWWGEIEKKYW